MANIVQMDEPLTFGKRQGWTGKQLLKDPSGCNYLAWVYNNTDIQIDARIVGVLKLMGLIEFKRIRLNSLIDGKRTILNESQMEMVQDNIDKLRERLAISSHDALARTRVAWPGSFTLQGGDSVNTNFDAEKLKEAMVRVGNASVLIGREVNVGVPVSPNCRSAIKITGY
ncbi:MAG: hypothetical protein CMO80_22175 [Verrucomicrobiales bacterium]|nr:hypothetical protein [Verrucomicrobiales bacterium]|tara:strand:+ start:28007 stop:28516 length:510 start_codon:yes stop_codon:yes gene_type:complete